MLQNLSLAFRSLRKAPGFTAVAVLTLALGVGANTAIFSVVNAVLLNPFPYKDGNKLIFVGCARQSEPDSQMSVAYADYLDWRKAAQSVDHLVFATGTSATLTGTKEPAVLRQASITANAWPLLGLAPLTGRVFTEDEDRPGADPVCVLSHATWQQRFSGDPAILGRAITLDGKSYTVIGVMPPTFKFWAGDVWTPVGLTADTDIMRSRIMRMDSWVVTRAKAGKDIQDVRNELSVIAGQVALAHPDTNKDVTTSARYLSESVSGPFRDPLFILLGAVVGLLLIACANVANLLLARTSTRRREFAVRAALGASRGQIVRQILWESLPLALLGGAAGVVMAVWGLDGLLALLPVDAVPAESQIRVNLPVLGFALVLTLGTMLLFALFPALESSRAAVTPALQEGSRGTAGPAARRVRSGLIIAEVALSLMLLAAAGLLIRDLTRVYAVDLGFERKQLLVIPLQLPESRYGQSEQATTFFEDAIARLRSLPSVASVGASTNVPFVGGNGMPLAIEGKTYTSLDQIDGTQFALVTPDYFRAQGLRLLRGRGFDENDRAGSPPVIILNEAAVSRFLPGGDPIGKRVMLGAPDNLITPGMLVPGFDKFQWATVIGVVQSARHFGLTNTAPPNAYIPVRQGWDYPPMRRGMTLVIRTRGEALDAVPSVRGALQSLDRDLPVQRIATMDQLVRDSLQGVRFNAVLIGLFAATALALSAVGIYGVVAWTVTQRTREIGVRLALGADRQSVLRLVIGQSMRTVAFGLLAGLAGSIGVTHALHNLVTSGNSYDPWTISAVLAILALVALAACWLPARRATKVDPMVALRTD